MTFVFVSGRTALDFVGTLKWRTDEPEEQLTTPADLRAWLDAAALTDRVPPVEPVDFDQALALREVIYRAVSARVAGRPPRPADRRALNRAAAPPPLGPVLTGSGERRVIGGFGAVLSTLARDAIDAIGGPDGDRLRRCANPRCTRVYVDTSRAGNRRWCGMAECGNAAKVAAFRARHQG
jgi:predicted RNA-binding Zn ribbon-like protein